MIYGLWQSAAGLQAQDYRQTVIANNLANAETPGFKPDRVSFQERLNAATVSGDLRARHPSLDSISGGLYEAPLFTDFAQGGLVPSNNPLDVAIDGSGFLSVKTTEGTRYTRDGRLATNRDGMIIHLASNKPVLNEDGGAMFVDLNSRSPIKIDETGMVRQGEQTIGRLGIIDVDNPQALRKTSDDLYAAEGARARPADARIRQGAYEASGVEPIQALVEMISATRAYEANARMITLQDESLGRMVSELGRFG